MNINALIDEKYRVLRKIGEGGMATVYEAENIRLNNRFALKFMHVALKSRDANVERFLREASALATLNHPNIVQIFDVTEHDGTPVIVMELLHGDSLGDLLANHRRPSINDLYELAEEMLHALEHAHAHDFVHRDIKPDNIFLHFSTPHQSSFKLMDFGIARGAEDHSLTSTGQFIGTRRYASPEQIQSPRSVDARTDLYSLGVTLWECATGQVPHDNAESEFDVMHAITTTPYLSLPDDFADPRLALLIRRLTMASAEDRPQSAYDALALLRRPANQAGTLERTFREQPISHAQPVGSSIARSHSNMLEGDSTAFHNHPNQIRKTTSNNNLVPYTKPDDLKSQWASFFSTLVLGPIGLIYASWPLAIIVIILTLIGAYIQAESMPGYTIGDVMSNVYGFILPTWIQSIFLGALATSDYNNKKISIKNPAFIATANVRLKKIPKILLPSQHGVKNQILALILAMFFGPFGLFYYSAAAVLVPIVFTAVVVSILMEFDFSGLVAEDFAYIGALMWLISMMVSVFIATMYTDILLEKNERNGAALRKWFRENVTPNSE